MSDITPIDDLNVTENELKEKVYERENVWIIPDRYYLEYNLSPTQALILTIIRQTSKKKGFSEVSYSYIRKYTKQKSDNSIKSDIDFLLSENRIYRHSYMSKRGRRSKLVYPDTAGKYWSYLTACQNFTERKKFEEEFMIHLSSTPDPDDSPPTPPPSKFEGTKSASSKFEDAASSKNEDAINTTYLHNRKSDVTCKGGKPPIAAASSDPIRKELENVYSQAQVDVMMDWYSLQTEEKKAGMKNPVACIISAYKNGYAVEQVQEVKAEEAKRDASKAQKLQVKRKRYEEMGNNEKLAHQIADRCKEYPGMECKVDSKCFFVKCVNAQESRVDDPSSPFHGGRCFVMPSGGIWHGANGVKVDFDLPSDRFKKDLKIYFEMCLWTKESKKQAVQ